MTGSVNEVLEKLQTRILAYEVIFQSLLAEVPGVLKDRIADNARHNFAAIQNNTHNDEEKAQKIEAAKGIAEQLLGKKFD